MMEALVNTKRLQKIILAKKVGDFLERDQKSEEREAVEGVARMLVEDMSAHVRGTLAFSLRQTKNLPDDIAERIARDSEDVAIPFLAETPAFTDKQLARLVPKLEEFARITLARRKDIGDEVAITIASVGKEASVTYLLSNDKASLPEEYIKRVAKRFAKNQTLLDALAERDDLPLVVAQDIIDTVSDRIRDRLVEKYQIAPRDADTVVKQSKQSALLERLKKASRTQIHGLAVDLRRDNKLDLAEVAELAEQGSLAFLESALAVNAAETVSRVREILSLRDEDAFVRLLKLAKVPQTVAPRIVRLARAHYGKPPTLRS